MPRAVVTQAAPVARLRVLFVEDCAADADVILDRPRQSGFDPSSRTVDTELDYISGYATEAFARQLKLDRGQPYVQKPFTASQLVSYVRGVLDGRPELKGPA